MSESKKIIIGIHGLANKLERAKHKTQWIDSIKEGVQNVAPNNEYNIDTLFEDVYWANYLYKYPLHDDTDYSFDSLFDKESYYKASPSVLREYEDSVFDKMRAIFQSVGEIIIEAGKKANPIDDVSRMLISKTLKDLDFYYSKAEIKDRDGKKRSAKAILKDELKNTLIKHKDSDIFLIAHSMGSIITYDVLRDLGKSHPELVINHFVTVGSPLGLPYVQNRIAKERDDKKVRTPTIVKNWVNYTDPNDPVAFDLYLHDDYKANNNGVIVKDDLVSNDYVSPITNKANPHKIFGYLRTPEFSKYLVEWLKN